MPVATNSKEVRILILERILLPALIVWVLAGQVSTSTSMPDPGVTTGRDPTVNQPTTITDGFESGVFSALCWESGGDRPWFIAADRSFGGVFSARSSHIGPGQTSELVLDLKFNSKGEFSFWVAVDSDSVRNRLTFFLDGEEQAQWSGRVDWVRHATYVTSGQHRFSWVYHVDSAIADGWAAAWIDNVTFPWPEEIDPSLLPPAAEAFIRPEPFAAPWTHSR